MALLRSPLALMIPSSALLLFIWLRARHTKRVLLTSANLSSAALDELESADASDHKATVTVDQHTGTATTLSASAHRVQARRIQAALRGWVCRHLLGPRTQGTASQGGRRSTSIRVCGANTCCIRGADDVFESLEDLVPPGDVQIGRTACFGRCGLGPNVSVQCNGQAARTCHAVDTPDATCRLLRSSGVKVPRMLRHASRLREDATRAAEDADFAASEALAAAGVRALTSRCMLDGSVAALRLRHKLLLLQATAAREQALRGVYAHVATWLACAREARSVVERLHRAHGSGPHAHIDIRGPRLHPALLLEVEALVHLAGQHVERPREVPVLSKAAEHRGQARELLQRLDGASDGPVRSRVHRVRASERREAQSLQRALDDL